MVIIWGREIVEGKGVVMGKRWMVDRVVSSYGERERVMVKDVRREKVVNNPNYPLIVDCRLFG